MLVIQLLGLIAFFFLLVGFWSKTKDQILVMHLLANSIYSIHYFLLKAYSGASVCILVVLSDLLLRNKTDKKALIRHGIVFSILFLISGMITYTNNGLLSLFPNIAAIFTMYLLSKEDANDVRLGMVFVSLMWSTYGFVVKSYVVGITEFILAISNTMAYIKYKKG